MLPPKLSECLSMDRQNSANASLWIGIQVRNIESLSHLLYRTQVTLKSVHRTASKNILSKSFLRVQGTK
ncbi:hypothetical protein BUQ74_03920 [Leptospira weilii serovar Heyan]|nr:hypothetical protein BUQ74_03920 [Leptospira weilii serovar Heyan]